MGLTTEVETPHFVLLISGVIFEYRKQQYRQTKQPISWNYFQGPDDFSLPLSLTNHLTQLGKDGIIFFLIMPTDLFLQLGAKLRGGHANWPAFPEEDSLSRDGAMPLDMNANNKCP